MYFSPNRTPEVKRRQDVEVKIVKATVKALLAAGCSLGVNDGDDDLVLHHSTDTKALHDALINTDEDYLYVYFKGDQQKWEDISKSDPTPDGWVRFVYGNDGWDVICDYTTNLEPYIGEGTEVRKLIEKYS